MSCIASLIAKCINYHQYTTIFRLMIKNGIEQINPFSLKENNPTSDLTNQRITKLHQILELNEISLDMISGRQVIPIRGQRKIQYIKTS